jgi:hypothetical protein
MIKSALAAIWQSNNWHDKSLYSGGPYQGSLD